MLFLSLSQKKQNVREDREGIQTQIPASECEQNRGKVGVGDSGLNLRDWIFVWSSDSTNVTQITLPRPLQTELQTHPKRIQQTSLIMNINYPSPLLFNIYSYRCKLSWDIII